MFKDAVTKTYQGAEKYRAVAAKYFFPDRRKSAFLESLQVSDVSKKEMYIRYMRMRGHLEDRDISEFRSEETIAFQVYLIGKSLQFTFGNSDIVPGRFNTSSFPALYTAKDVNTCEAEYRGNIRHGDPSKFSFVIFTVQFSGRAKDFRPVWFKDRVFSMPSEHKECQIVVDKVRREYDAIVAPSARFPEGSCCAIFNKPTVEAGSVVIEKQL